MEKSWLYKGNDLKQDKYWYKYKRKRRTKQKQVRINIDG